MPLFSIGYGNRDISQFLSLLQKEGIDTLADVRSVPRSGYHTEFNQGELSNALSGLSIEYHWLGQYLGGRPENPALYDHQGYVNYLDCQDDLLFQQGFAQLRQWDQQGKSVALMCAELRPEECHRSRIVGEGLEKMGIDLIHIDQDGKVISQQAVRHRLDGGQTSLLGISPSSPLARSDRPIGKDLI